MGPDQHTSLHTIANVLQEVASNHAVAMWGRSEEGFASDPSLEEGLIFVMTRLQIQMDEFPRWWVLLWGGFPLRDGSLQGRLGLCLCIHQFRAAGHASREGVAGAQAPTQSRQRTLPAQQQLRQANHNS